MGEGIRLMRRIGAVSFYVGGGIGRGELVESSCEYIEKGSITPIKRTLAQ